jgi:hypothetical protein
MWFEICVHFFSYPCIAMPKTFACHVNASSAVFFILVAYYNKFNRELPLLLDVPNRIAVRIHRGNTAKDTQGCILVGNNDKVGWVSNSAKYEQKIVDLIKQYKECWVTIG